MLIHDMTRQASVELLERVPLGRLGCSHEDQPYITPIYFGYHENYLYSFSMQGLKIAWMRANPRVCVEVDEVTNPHDWSVVIVFGSYEELPDTPEHEIHRRRVYNLLQKRPMWWEPGALKPALDPNARLEYIYFRIHIGRISGHRGVPDTIAGDKVSHTNPRPASRMRKTLRRPGHERG